MTSNPNWFPGTEGTHFAGVAIPEVPTCPDCLKALNPDDDDEGEGCECEAELERQQRIQDAWDDYAVARSQYHHLRRD